MATKFTVLQSDVEVFVFGDMKVGDVFRFNDQCFIRIQQIQQYNAVGLTLDGGNLSSFRSDDGVIPVKEVVIKM